MTCPDCERHKISASMWRNKAYELGGTPLPWNAEELIEKAVLEEREAIAQSLDKQADLAADEIDRQWAQEMAAAVRARGQE
jgi:hypothetical protein